MNAFWPVALFLVALLVMLVFALGVILPPLLRKPSEHLSGRRDLNIAVYRDQLKELDADRHNGLLDDAQFEQAKLELEDRLAEDAITAAPDANLTDHGGRRVALVLAVLLPVAALGIYYKLGQPMAVVAQPAAQSASAGHNGADIDKMMASLRARTEQEPNNAKVWLEYGTALAMMERADEAVVPLSKAVELDPQNADALAQLAEAKAIANGRNLSGEPMQLVQKALAINPSTHKALELAGIDAFQNQQYQKAADYWKSLLAQLDPNTAYAKDIAAAEHEARQKAGGVPALDDLRAPPAASNGNAFIAGRVELAPVLKARAKPEQMVFLAARSLNGGPPLAVIRVQVKDLPFDFKLDESNAMMPSASLATVDVATLNARVSASGQPMPGSGDLEGSVSNVKVGSKGVRIVIDKVLP